MTNQKKKELIEKKMLDIINILEVKVDDGNEATAKRIAKMYVDEIFKNVNNNSIQELNDKMTIFKAPANSEMIVVKDIPFFSNCEHHFMPFFGKIAVGYIPNTKIIGLSKIPRIVDYFSKKPQVQERLTTEIGQYLFNSKLKPYYVIVKLYNIHHTCVSARGIEKECTTDSLYYLGGECSSQEELRNYKKEFLDMIK